MKVPVQAMKIVCDHCGELYENGNGYTCWVGDEDGSQIEEDAVCDEWFRTKDGKHYCPKCYKGTDDEGHVHTADGKVYDWYTEEEVKNES